MYLDTLCNSKLVTWKGNNKFEINFIVAMFYAYLCQGFTCSTFRDQVCYFKLKGFYVNKVMERTWIVWKLFLR